jgi:hypothetical protein
LKRHRSNYTEEGPKYLQLLWWEFPEEHWGPLREGCKLGFIIAPGGELKAIAGRFMDELKNLGVLKPTTEEIIANCPLFCVDKSILQPGEKRCIANCKRGGQNGCCGKDPVYLVQTETILHQLYSGGYSGVADASKQFHNFPTHPSKYQYIGCCHPVTDEPLYYAGLLMGTTNSPAIACRINN